MFDKLSDVGWSENWKWKERHFWNKSDKKSNWHFERDTQAITKNTTHTLTQTNHQNTKLNKDVYESMRKWRTMMKTAFFFEAVYQIREIQMSSKAIEMTACIVEVILSDQLRVIWINSCISTISLPEAHKRGLAKQLAYFNSFRRQMRRDQCNGDQYDHKGSSCEWCWQLTSYSIRCVLSEVYRRAQGPKQVWTPNNWWLNLLPNIFFSTRRDNSKIDATLTLWLLVPSRIQLSMLEATHLEAPQLNS